MEEEPKGQEEEEEEEDEINVNAETAEEEEEAMEQEEAEEQEEQPEEQQEVEGDEDKEEEEEAQAQEDTPAVEETGKSWLSSVLGTDWALRFQSKIRTMHRRNLSTSLKQKVTLGGPFLVENGLFFFLFFWSQLGVAFAWGIGWDHLVFYLFCYGV